MSDGSGQPGGDGPGAQGPVSAGGVPPRAQGRSLMANLGAMFGHVVKAIKTDVTQASERVASEERREAVETRLGPGERVVTTTDEVVAKAARAGEPGQVIARRTVVDEVRVERDGVQDA